MVIFNKSGGINMQLDFNKVKQIIILALKEDIGKGDITTISCIPKQKIAKAKIIAKEEGIVCGLDIVKHVFKIFDPKVKIINYKKDGDKVKKHEIVVEIIGKATSILSTERIILNFLQMMSGVATTSNRYVKKAGKVKVLDTRKTLPGMRYLQKYAVKCGGAVNHRMGLYDMVLIKDNHIVIANGITNAVKLCKEKYPKAKIEVECSSLEQVNEALKTQCDWIMLDNMDINTIKKAVKIINKKKIVEVSGGVNLDSISKISKTGVDYTSIGALTHSYKALDISMDIEII
jgi:nicotinate-nucleotide pyrophosphorylase (carboxylating)